MPFNAFRENKTLAKISEFTVAQTGIYTYMLVWKRRGPCADPEGLSEGVQICHYFFSS